jgi:hypothetical protein
MAWQSISPAVTVKGYISKAVDVTSDDMLSNDNEEDGDVSGECEEDAGTDCEDGDRICHYLHIKFRKLITKYFFPSRCFIFGVT